MNTGELAVLLALAALCLWLTIFLFTLLDHFVYRGTYGHFLLGIESIDRQAGASAAGVTAMTSHMRQAKSGYLGRYLSNAASPGALARMAAEEYISRMGAGTLIERAADCGSRRRAARLVALYALSRVGDPDTLPLLEEAIGSNQPVLAYAALDMLDIHGSPGAAEVLLRALGSGVLPASRIATHMEHFRVDLTDLYVSWLEGGNPRLRYWIAYLMGRSSFSERTEEILAVLLSDQAPDVRKIALSGLIALDSPRLQEHAERMLDDPVFYVRTQAARALSKCPNAQAVRALAQKLSDEDDAVQLAVKRSLVELGPVTLEHLANAGQLTGARAAAVAEITNSIRHAQGGEDVSALIAKQVTEPTHA